MPKGVRFESRDSEAEDELEGFLEKVDAPKDGNTLQVPSFSPLHLHGRANSQTNSPDQSLMYKEQSLVQEEESLPPGWMRKSRARAKGGKTDWYVVSPAGQIFRSQKQLDAFTWRKGLHRIALKPQGLKQADKKRPAEE